MSNREELLRQALEEVLLALAQLCLGHGMPYAQAEAQFKRAYVRAARRARRAAGGSTHRDVSQVATATGLSRRDVDRIGTDEPVRAAQRMSPATQTFTRWVSDPAYRHRNGRLKVLPRQGPAPSFESLAASVTRHVHPRSLLDEMQRLGLVELSPEGERVTLRADRAAAPPGSERQYQLLAANVADHLAAATANVLSGRSRHLEQAVFANGLSAESVAAMAPLVRRQWQRLLAELAPTLQRLIDEDERAGRTGSRRMRIGLYSYDDETTPGDDDASLP